MPTANQITCPHCHKAFNVDEALTHQFQEKFEQELDSKLQEKLKFEKEKAWEEAKKQISAQLEDRLKLQQEELEQKTKQLDEARKFELELRKKANQLEEDQKAFEVEKQRQLDMERETIRLKTLESVTGEWKMREKEYEKRLTDMKVALEDAQRKASQTSQQLQGEVQELDLEETLRSAFVHDEIQPVGKGVRGADIRQIVKTPRGNVCGVILWESKRTKAWAGDWTLKLKDDQRAENAHVAVIVSNVLPKEISANMGLHEGVWVSTYDLFIPLAQLLREKLIEVAKEKYLMQNQVGKAEMLYGYITSHEFAQQVEAIAEVYLSMKEQINKERIVFEKQWKERETQVQRLMNSTSRIVGSISGAGATLPQIKGIDLLE